MSQVTGPERSGERAGSAGQDRAGLLEALNWESRRSSVFVGLVSRAVAARLKLNVVDVEALGVLDVIGAVTPTRLAGLLGMGTGSVTLVVDRLERAGFVRRVRDSRDRRSLSIELVEGRHREMAAVYGPLLRAAADVVGRYSDRELAVIVDYITRSNDMLHEVSTVLAGDES